MSNDVGNRASYIYTQRSDSLDVTENDERIQDKKKIYERKNQRTDAKPNEQKKFVLMSSKCV